MNSTVPDSTTTAIGNGTNMTLNCPVYAPGDDVTIVQFSFWVEGVCQCCIAIGGLIGNFISALILSRDEMRNSFNLLLISLLCFDSWYLFGSILENMRRNFGLGSDLHTLLFPYLLYPAQSVAMSASIFMTVGIALERYIAVHYPIDYNQSMNSAEACRARLMKYLFPVIIFAIVFNIPKFLEARIDYVADRDSSLMENVTSLVLEEEIKYVPKIVVTNLRRDPYYAIYYNNWTRLALLGIIPAAMLIYLNYKIYKDIKLRQDRRRQSMSQVTLNHQARRRQEDNLAVVFMGIVGVFLLCHVLRIALNLHEMFVIEDAMACSRAGQRSFPKWALITTFFSHVFLVVNSSTNMIIYCALNSTFRKQFVRLMRDILKKLRCLCCKNVSLSSNGGSDAESLNYEEHEKTATVEISPKGQSYQQQMVVFEKPKSPKSNGKASSTSNGEEKHALLTGVSNV